SWQKATQQLYLFYRENGQNEEALEVLQALLLDKPQQKNLYLEAGKLAANMDSIAIASQMFKKFYLMEGTLGNTQTIARSLIDADALQEALPYVEKIKKLNPTDEQASRYIFAINGILKEVTDKNTLTKKSYLLQMARYYRQLDQPKISLKWVDKTLEIDPGNIEAMQLKQMLEIE
ncbi:MAG: hypothetical protein WA951_00570, partial [Leeuwenhoekiella sp.]